MAATAAPDGTAIVSWTTNLKPSGAAADYVSGTSGDGEVRVRVRCTRTANFVASGDFMRLTYQR